MRKNTAAVMKRSHSPSVGQSELVGHRQQEVERNSLCVESVWCKVKGGIERESSNNNKGEL
mgnify:CR=1 FL=1